MVNKFPLYLLEVYILTIIQTLEKSQVLKSLWWQPPPPLSSTTPHMGLEEGCLFPSVQLLLFDCSPPPVCSLPGARVHLAEPGQ